MRKVILKLSKQQFDILKVETCWPNPVEDFALLAQPLMSNKTMPVLILTTAEFKRASKFMKRFVPKELSSLTPPKQVRG